MIRAVFFDTTTGEIVQIFPYDDGTAGATIDADAPAGTDWIDSATARHKYDYIDDPGGAQTVTERPVLYATDHVELEADGSDSVTFAVPSGTVVTPEDEPEYTTAGADFDFSAPGIGEWVFHIEPPFPYQILVLTVTAVTRQVQTDEVADSAIQPLKLSAETVSVNSAYATGPFSLADADQNILVYSTLTFEAIDAPAVKRRFTVSGVVGSAVPLLSATARVFINIDTGSGWIFPVGTYLDHSDFFPQSHSLTCVTQSVYEIVMDGATTSITFGLDVYIAAGQSGDLKNASLVIQHHATAEA